MDPALILALAGLVLVVASILVSVLAPLAGQAAAAAARQELPELRAGSHARMQALIAGQQARRRQQRRVQRWLWWTGRLGILLGLVPLAAALFLFLSRS